MKICTRCKLNKPYHDFRVYGGKRVGIRSRCIVCELQLKKEYDIQHKARQSAARKLRYTKRRDIELASGRQYKMTNRARVTAKTMAWQKKREAIDPSYRMARQLRIRLNTALHGGFKAGSAVRDIGCTMPELMSYLQNKFAPGMTWDNYGQWHIDHIMPLAMFDLTDRIQFLRACNYTNLQPLWANDNLRKGDRYESLPTLSGR